MLCMLNHEDSNKAKSSYIAIKTKDTKGVQIISTTTRKTRIKRSQSTRDPIKLNETPATSVTSNESPSPHKRSKSLPLPGRETELLIQKNTQGEDLSNANKVANTPVSSSYKKAQELPAETPPLFIPGFKAKTAPAKKKQKEVIVVATILQLLAAKDHEKLQTYLTEQKVATRKDFSSIVDKIFANTLFNQPAEILEDLFRIVPENILQKTLSNENFSNLSMFLMGQTCLVTGDNDSVKKDRIKKFELLLTIDSKGVRQFMENYDPQHSNPSIKDDFNQANHNFAILQKQLFSLKQAQSKEARKNKLTHP